MLSLKSILVKNKLIEGSLIEEESVLMDRDEGEIIRLNPVAGFVWNAVDGKRSVEEILAEVADTFDADEKRIRKDVIRFLKKLLKQEIVLSQEYESR